MPIHTVYVGAHAFDAATPRRLAEGCRGFFGEVFPDSQRLADVFDLAPDLAGRVHRRVAALLAEEEPIEDLRVDFEDGYVGDDPEAEARRVAEAAMEAREAGELPDGFGLRIPSVADEGAERILDLFARGFDSGLDSSPFVVTLAMVNGPDEVARLADLLDAGEPSWGLPAGSVGVELMAETPRSIYDAEGRLALPSLVAAARGRCVGVHFGVYDYTASLGLLAGQQRLRHPACDVARGVLQVGVAGLDGAVELSDGSSRVVPRLDMDDASLTAAMRQVWDDVRHSLEHGIRRGWDMAPPHVVIRRLAVGAFFLEHLPEMQSRWAEAMAETADDLLEGDLEDAATLRALRSYFRRGREAGALGADDLPAGLAGSETLEP